MLNVRLRENFLSGEVPPPMSYNDLRRYYGLPVYTSKWLPDHLIVMGNRGGKTLAQKGWEYAQKMADRQKREDPAVPTNEYWHTYTVGNSSTVNNNYLYNPGWNNGTVYVDNTVFGDPQKSYIVRSDPLLQEAVAKEETPEAWLRRRVEEICWRPA